MRSLKTVFLIAVIVASIAIPLAIQQSAQGKTLDFFYLGALLGAITVGYTGIYLAYYLRLRRFSGTVTGIDDHLLPLAMLIGLTNFLLGMLSVIDDVARAGSSVAQTEMVTSCHNHAICFGTVILEVFPGAYLPTGIPLYAFWGTFVFNCWQYLQRIGDDDFPPSVWIYGCVRLGAATLASSFVFLIFFYDAFDFDAYVQRGGILEPRAGSPLSPGLAVSLAFLIGFFPMATIKTVSRAVLDRISRISPTFGKYTYTPITIIDGITREVEERLAEAGIDSLQLLSRSNVAELKDRNRKALPYPDDVISDWIDQARLALFFSEEAHIAAIRDLGIRTYSDLKNFQIAAKANPNILQNIDPTPIPPEKFKAFVLYGQFP